MWKSRTGHAAENPGHWPSERRGKGEARTALLEGPKPVCRNPRVSLWHETQTNRLCLIWRTAVYGPVCTVVWEGRSRETPPYPDCGDARCQLFAFNIFRFGDIIGGQFSQRVDGWSQRVARMRAR